MYNLYAPRVVGHGFMAIASLYDTDSIPYSCILLQRMTTLIYDLDTLDHIS